MWNVLVKLNYFCHTITLMRDRIMPLGLQIYTIKKIFNSLNPDFETDDLDFDNIDFPCNFHESLNDMKNAHPQFIWESLEDMTRRYDEEEKTYNTNLRIEAGLEPEDSVESFSKTRTHWKVEQTKEGEIHSIEIKIKPRSALAKGRKYTYGYIQLTVPTNLVGLKAKISVFKPKES